MLDLFAFPLKCILKKKQNLFSTCIQQMDFAFLKSLRIVLELTAARIYHLIMSLERFLIT